MGQMAQEAKACAGDLAGLVAEKTKALQTEVILIRCSRDQCGRAHIVPVVLALPVAVAMAACSWVCVVMGSHQTPDCSWVLEGQVEYIVTVAGGKAVADAVEGCTHSGPEAGQVVSSVGDKDRRRNLGCCSTVPAVAAD